ncbi:phytanoyl-CoA dioxygenase family protein [Aquibium sp. LZ166]|uniref:Phytanoyl-CoA dioxygenase family protein n=1 Tax=Aquibium pacificus TaxID=3153579 RepID=A0ABV3SV43_9HYPH
MTGLPAADLSFWEHGAEIISGAVPLSVVRLVAEAFAKSIDGRAGVRSLEADPGVAAILAPGGHLGLVAQQFSEAPGDFMRPVRVVFFDKTPEVNWAVPWHQDRTIAVAERCEVDGFASWNRKNGVDHVEPPVWLLSRMITLRLHVDDAGAENGALDILPGSHRLGRVPAADVEQAVRAGVAVKCMAKSGDILAIRLTTIHRSVRSARPSRRRVLHVDYSPDDLPAPLRWRG